MSARGRIFLNDEPSQLAITACSWNVVVPTCVGVLIKQPSGIRTELGDTSKLLLKVNVIMTLRGGEGGRAMTLI